MVNVLAASGIYREFESQIPVVSHQRLYNWYIMLLLHYARIMKEQGQSLSGL